MFQTADQYKKHLLDRASQGRLTEEVKTLFLKYAECAAREKLVPGAVSPEFWSWAMADSRLSTPLLLLLDPLYDKGVPERLNELREADSQAVNGHSQLSLAFAAVYGGNRAVKTAAGGAPRLSANAPTMTESFAYYIKVERDLIFPIGQAPWPVLAYTADIELTLAERGWALQRYRGRKDSGSLYYDVPYDDAKAMGKPRLGDRPYTLENILRYGGVCADRAYYSVNVLKSFGVPAMSVYGDGARGGHAWLAWCGERNRQIALLDSGRFDYDQYYTGRIKDPLGGKDILDRNVELLAKAVATSYDRYLEAEVGCHVYDLAAAEKGVFATTVLQDAAACNPYDEGVWRRLGQAAADGVFPQDQAEKMFDGMLRAFEGNLDLTFEVLQKVLAPRLGVGHRPRGGRGRPLAEGQVVSIPLKVAAGDTSEVTANLQLLDRVLAFYDKRDRPDLAVEVRCLQGAYLERLGKTDMALRLYVQDSEAYAKKHFGFLKLFGRVLVLMKDNQMRLNYLARMADIVPEYQSAWNRSIKARNPSFVHVLEQYAAALKTAGQDAKANALLGRLK